MPRYYRIAIAPLLLFSLSPAAGIAENSNNKTPVDAVSNSAGQTRPAGAVNKRPAPPTGWSTELGGAVILNPEFQGSSSYRVLPVPYFDFRYRDEKGVKYFANVPQGLGAYILRKQGTSGRRTAVSVALGPGFASRDPDDIDGLETFGPGVEARLGLETGSQRFGLSVTLAQAIGTGHEGLYADLGANYRRRVGQRGFLAVGPSVRFGDNNYMNALYGVTGLEETNSGIESFSAKAGFESLGIQALLSVPLRGKWRFTTVARVGSLLGDAKDSSLTEEPLQAFFLTAVTRRL